MGLSATAASQLDQAANLFEVDVCCVCCSIVNDVWEPFFDPPWMGVCKD